LDIGEITRTISYIELTNGIDTHSTNPGTLPLGVAANPDSPLLNGADGSVSFQMTSAGTLSLFAGNDGFIAEGLTYTATAHFTDGSQFIASYRIVPSADRALVAHSARITASPGAPATVVVSADSPGETVLTIDDIRDINGSLVPDGARIAISAADMASKDPSGDVIHSAGGSIVEGSPAPNNPSFKVFAIENGMVTVTYSSYPVTADPVLGTTARVQVQAADDLGNVLGTEAIATILINIRNATDRAIISMSPTYLYGDGSERSSHFKIAIRDAAGQPVGEGVAVTVTAGSCTKAPDESTIASAGGKITGGLYNYGCGYGQKFLTNADGMIEGDYISYYVQPNSNELVRTAVIQAAIWNTPNGSADSHAAGTATLPIVPAASAVIDMVPSAVPYAFPESSFAQIFVYHIHDKFSGLVPDGARFLISAYNHATHKPDGSYVDSAGGTITGGVSSSYSTSGFRGFTLTDSLVVAAYSIDGIAVPQTGETKTVNVQIVMATPTLSIMNLPVFAYAPLRVLGPDNAIGFAEPAAVLADGALHTTTITFDHILDSYGDPLPDGSKVMACGSSGCGRYYTDGPYLPGIDGQILNGDVSVYGSNSRYKLFTIQDGKVVIDYSVKG